MDRCTFAGSAELDVCIGIMCTCAWACLSGSVSAETFGRKSNCGFFRLPDRIITGVASALLSDRILFVIFSGFQNLSAFVPFHCDLYLLSGNGLPECCQ